MARPGRPVSESYQPMCCSVSQSASYSSEAGIVALEEEDEPIFSISKSSMDVVMATGPPHKRDPAWTRMDLRRSSSANTPSEQQAAMLQQLHPHVWQHMSAANARPLSMSALNVDLHSPRAGGGEVQRWSGGSGSTQSRSSTPDTIVWREGTSSRPSSLTHDMNFSAAVDSPMSMPATPSPFTSPLGTPTLPTVDLLTPESGQTLTPNRPEDRPVTPTPPSSLPARRLPSPLPTPSPSPRVPPVSPRDGGFPEDSLLMFQFPSPKPSSASLAEEGADVGCLLDNLITELQGTSQEPEDAEDDNGGREETVGDPAAPQSPADGLEDDGGREETIGDPAALQSPVDRLEDNGSREEATDDQAPQSPADGWKDDGSREESTGDPAPQSPADRRETGRVSCSKLELPWQPVMDICPSRVGGRSPLVSSLSDSRLGVCCCKCSPVEGGTKAPRAEGGTTTSRPQQVDAEVQTVSPCGSWWDLKRNTFASTMGSHSILGSPPGSRLNLKHSVGSHSNLVSPSSSMFPGNSSSAGEDEEGRGDDDPKWDVHSASSQDLDRRRSCLKNHGEDRDELGRRSSMKQVQWDENGMTWEIHGASVDPQVLSTAIQRHLELQNSPRPKRPSTKKKKAPKPPLLSSVVKAMTPELKPSGIVATSACIVDREKKEEEPIEVEEEKKKEEEEEEKEEEVEVPRRISRAEGAGQEEPEEEVYGEVGVVQVKSPSCGSGHSRTRSVIRSLRPGWCGGGSRKTDP